MHEFLTGALKLSIILFLVTSMMHIGTRLTVHQIVEPLRNVRLVLASLGVSYLLITMTVIHMLIILLPMSNWFGRRTA